MKLVGILVSTLALSSAVPAQTMVESAVSAAGGSAAAVAGKKVSDGVDKVFNKLGTIADGMGQPNLKDTLRKLPAPAPAMPAVRVQAHGTPMPVSPIASRYTAGNRQNSRNMIHVVPDPVTMAPAAVSQPAAAQPARPLPTSSDLQALSAGASRQEVVDRLGQPSSRITLNDERGLVETYSFRGENGSLGSVRLINGKLEEVRPVQ